MKGYAAVGIHQPKFTPGPWSVMFCRDGNTMYPQWVSRAEKPYAPVLNVGAFSRPASEVEAPLAKRRFRLAGTGHQVESAGLSYIGSFELSGGALVFHVFEVAP